MIENIIGFFVGGILALTLGAFVVLFFKAIGWIKGKVFKMEAQEFPEFREDEDCDNDNDCDIDISFN